MTELQARHGQNRCGTVPRSSAGPPTRNRLRLSGRSPALVVLCRSVQNADDVGLIFALLVAQGLDGIEAGSFERWEEARDKSDGAAEDNGDDHGRLCDNRFILRG